MASLNMGSAIEFTIEKINEKVPEKCGNYALGYIDDGTFYVQYVGRSDSGINSRLKSHFNSGSHKEFYRNRSEPFLT